MKRTPSQTVGPFFQEALAWKDGGPLRAPATGEAIAIAGCVTDGAGAPVGDAMVEAWQADPPGFVRALTGADGGFRIETPRPAGPHPHLDVAIFARGLLKPLRTRVYLAPPEQARGDPLLAPIAGSARLATLLARRVGPGEYRWDVRLQGDGETVFFAA